MKWMWMRPSQAVTTAVTVNMQIDTNEPGRVIGYHGKVLKALQLLAQNYLYNRYSKNFYITINVNDYVEHRAEVLQSYAQKLATRALEDGQANRQIRCQTVNAKSFTGSSLRWKESLATLKGKNQTVTWW